MYGLSSSSLLQINVPKGGFEIFCVEKPKTQVKQDHNR